MTDELWENDEADAEGENPASVPLLLHVEDDSVGERLDRFVVAALPDLSRSFVNSLIRDGNITVNGKAAKPGQALRRGEAVAVSVPPPKPSELLPENLPLDVIYEDNDVVVINKASGMVVHPSAGHSSGTLVNALLHRYPDMQVGNDLRPGIVHRLDRDTSGLMVIVRNDRARAIINEQQQARSMHKAYLVMLEGHLKEPEGTIDAPIARHPSDRLRQAIVSDGRRAVTHYRLIEEIGSYSLVEARLETGRTHQIRVHFAHIQRHVVGDPLYGLRKARASFGLQRQFLHSYQLGFRLPSSGEWQQWSAPLPAELQKALERIRASNR